MTPTVGRIVHYYPNSLTGPWAAVVTAVEGELLSLYVFPAVGQAYPVFGVAKDKRSGPYWEWPRKEGPS